MQIKFIKNRNSQFFIFCVLSSLIFIMCIPLLQHGFVMGDDYWYHLSRIQSIADTIQEGVFPVKIHTSLLNGFGYGNGLFYPNLFLFFPALLVLCGVSLSLSYKIFLIFVLIGLTLSVYLSSKYIIKNRYAALISTILFLTSQAMITNIYLRAAVGETLATIFLPIVIAGLYNIIYDGFSKPWIIILGFTGLMYSHNITLVLVLGVSIIVLLINFKKVFLRNSISAGKLIGKLCISAIISLLLSISYWLPFLEQLLDSKFQIPQNWDISVWTLKLYQVFGLDRPGIGLPLLIFAIAVLVICQKCFKNNISLQYILIGLVLTFLTTDLFCWSLLNGSWISKIQFPWRLMPMAVTFLALGVGAGITHLLKNKYKTIILLSIYVFFCMFSINNLCKLSTNTTTVSSDIIYEEGAIGGGAEWLPENTDVSKLNFSNHIITSNGTMLDINEKHANTITFEYNALQDGESEYFDIPLLYYKGYGAEIVTSNGTYNNLEVVKSPNNNVVRVLNPNLDSGRICVKYSGTVIQYISYVINIVVIVALIICFIFRKKLFQNHKPC